jgi:hypothetical protein
MGQLCKAITSASVNEQQHAELIRSVEPRTGCSVSPNCAMQAHLAHWALASCACVHCELIIWATQRGATQQDLQEANSSWGTPAARNGLTQWLTAFGVAGDDACTWTTVVSL